MLVAAAAGADLGGGAAATGDVPLPRRWVLQPLRSTARALRLYAAVFGEAEVRMCRSMRDYVSKTVLVLTAAYEDRLQFQREFGVEGQPVAAMLVDHLTGMTDAGAWAVKELAKHLKMSIEVYVRPLQGGGGAGGGEQPTAFRVSPGFEGGPPLCVAWTAAHGFMAIQREPQARATPSSSSRGTTRSPSRRRKRSATTPQRRGGRNSSPSQRRKLS